MKLSSSVIAFKQLRNKIGPPLPGKAHSPGPVKLTIYGYRNGSRSCFVADLKVRIARFSVQPLCRLCLCGVFCWFCLHGSVVADTFRLKECHFGCVRSNPFVYCTPSTANRFLHYGRVPRVTRKIAEIE